MANQPENGNYDLGVYQIETTDPVVGGVGGIANTSLLNLANRTGYLKAQLAIIEEEIAALAPLNSPFFTGTVQGPTPAPGDNSQKFATTAFLAAAFAGVAGKPGYQTFLDGLIVQMGSVTIIGGQIQAYIELPIPFPHNYLGGLVVDGGDLAYRWAINAGRNLGEISVFLPLWQMATNGAAFARNTPGVNDGIGSYWCWGN